MPETGFLLTAKTFSFQKLIQILLLCYKDRKCVYIVFVFHKQTYGGPEGSHMQIKNVAAN